MTRLLLDIGGILFGIAGIIDIIAIIGAK